MQKNYQKNRYQENPKLHVKYQKMRYQNCHVKYQKKRYQNCQENKKMIKLNILYNKVNKGPIAFSQHAIEACTNVISDYNYKDEKYQIITAEMYDPVKSFDENLYICETCHKPLRKNEIPRQAVSNTHIFPDINMR